MQIENKINIKDVQYLFRHKGAKTTQLHYNSVIDQELDYEGSELLDSLFNDTTLYNGEEHVKKDVPAYRLDNNTFNEEKPKTYEEMTDDELDRQYEELKRQREERRKRRKEKDMEM